MTNTDISIEIAAERPTDFGALAPVDEAALVRYPPKAFAIARMGTAAQARVALYGSDTPPLDGRRTGLLGHFFSKNSTATQPLLTEACRALREGGAEVAVGPINGSTWEKYRFVTWSDSSPAFFLEPENPQAWPLSWEDAGFSAVARYVSTERRNLTDYQPLCARHSARLVARGLRTWGVEPDGFEDALRRVYPLVRDAFAGNVLYTPLDVDQFLAFYRPATALVDPRFCRIAEMKDEVVGFAFAYRDPLELSRNGRTSTVVLKTIAARPGIRTAFTGFVLANEVDLAAIEVGAERVINALMYESADSTKLTAPFARLTRAYALYGRLLDK